MYTHPLYFNGFTVFGFWLPLVFWVGYLIFRGNMKLIKWILVAGIISLFLTVDTSGLNGNVYGLQNAAPLLLIPFYLIWWKDMKYLQAGALTYFIILMSDIIGVPVMSPQMGWLPMMLFTNVYHADFAHYECIGGAGALDGLFLMPLTVIVALYVVRMWENYFNNKK